MMNGHGRRIITLNKGGGNESCLNEESKTEELLVSC